MSASFPTYQPRLLYIDLFCGAGGVTTGVSRVPGVQVVACVNHDATAIASHAANHPDALHYTEDIRTLDISPIAARVAMLRLRYPDTKVVLWASCECTNFSRAKGGKTRDPDSRSLAEHLYRYIKALQPDYIQIENVTEFLEWGPMLEKDGKLVPDKARKGESFKLWFSHILDMGYSGDWRIFNAADFGAYTSRKRLFVQFGRYGLPLAWPVPTHSRENWKPCRDVLDLDDFGQSIFTRKKPLCDATLRRLTEGIKKFARPQFIFRYMSGPGHVHPLEAPCVTVCTQKNLYLAAGKFMDNYYGQGYATSIHAPVGTLCTKQQKYPVTAIFMASYYSGGGQISATEAPCPALTTVPKPRVVQCQFLDQQFGKSKPASLNRPSPAIMTNSHYSVATASFIRAMMRPGVKGLVYPLDKPMKTLLTRDYFYLDTCRYTGCPNYSQDAPGDTEAMLTLKRAMREAEQKWKMKTTQALAPEPSINSGYPVCVYAVVYEQYQDGGYDTEDRGALWLLHGGNSSRGCVKIATVKGVHCFESIYPFSGYYLDMENTNSWALAGAFLPATMHLHCNNVNPAYYGFSSMESNIIVSEAVEDFVDPEAETITED